jgi:hypothetical protein
MTQYRVITDGHDERIFRDGRPITLHQVVIELYALQGELDAATAALDKVRKGLRQLTVEAENS